MWHPWLNMVWCWVMRHGRHSCDSCFHLIAHQRSLTRQCCHHNAIILRHICRNYCPTWLWIPLQLLSVIYGSSRLLRFGIPCPKSQRDDAYTQLSSSTMTINTALLTTAAVERIPWFRCNVSIAWVSVEVPVAWFGLKHSTILSVLHITTP